MQNRARSLWLPEALRARGTLISGTPSWVVDARSTLERL